MREPWTILDDSNLSKNLAIHENLRRNPSVAGQIGAITGGGQSNKPRYTRLAVKILW
jgi:hypothetical protein